ncbi:AAA family ATPase [Bradyrhizobium japonicum]|uniref:AAA family ATPase n=1 Tax=Bradyrhizobium japonicum TaxID=375 RepID=UPI001BA575DD|nr:AAA family ATPase [Bradyrhizobium japonicum]MBR0993795.1 AAA family ATPase [Bradyrhizobium japonicum]
MKWGPVIDAELARDPLPIIDPRDWQDKPVPARDWLVDGLIPLRVVTLKGGDGGTGKTLAALQLAIAMSLKRDWFGKKVMPGPVLIFTAEDEADELHRRFAAVLAQEGRQFRDLEGVTLVPMAGLDAVLASQNPSGGISTTAQFDKLRKLVEQLNPRLVVIDPAADVFGGEENARAQVRQFMQKLNKLALDNDCAVLLLAHPSLSGLTSGRGTSGSTAWSNSARSRLYLEMDKDDPDRRVLRVMKANHGRVGAEITLRWNDGVFVLDQGGDRAADSLANRAADDVFMNVFWKMTSVGVRFSHKRTSATYAPKEIAKHPNAKGYSKDRMAQAMQRLLEAGTLKIEEQGPPSRRYEYLVAVVN